MYLLVTLIVVVAELAVPLELLGVQLYTPMSLLLIFLMVRVEPVSPDITIPFLIHWYVRPVGVPPATTLISTELPEDTVCGSLMLMICAGPINKEKTNFLSYTGTIKHTKYINTDGKSSSSMIR